MLQILEVAKSSQWLVRGLSHRFENPSPEGGATPLSAPEMTGTVLTDFIESSQLWSRERVAVPRRLRWALFALIPMEIFWTIWLDHRHRIHRMPRTDLYGHHPRPPRRSATRLRRF